MKAIPTNAIPFDILFSLSKLIIKHNEVIATIAKTVELLEK